MRKPVGAVVRLACGFGLTALLLVGVFDSAEWYAQRVSIPRYCADKDGATERVRQVLTRQQPAQSRGMRAHVVAAKLIYLVPQNDGEPLEGYLQRLRERIEEACNDLVTPRPCCRACRAYREARIEAHCPVASGEGMKRVSKGFRVGPAVFLITLAATLVFFWWLLIYDHGVPAVH